jgi:hypothetical protein
MTMVLGGLAAVAMKVHSFLFVFLRSLALPLVRLVHLLPWLSKIIGDLSILHLKGIRPFLLPVLVLSVLSRRVLVL